MSRPASTRPGWLACYDELIGAWSRRSGNRHDAEDAAHDAIEHLLKADGSVAAKARGYLFQAAGHRLIDRWRRQRREQHVPLDELDEHDQPLQADQNRRCARRGWPTIWRGCWVNCRPNAARHSC